MKPLLVHFGTRILFEVRHFPPTSIHHHALDAAQAAECAADQGKFWEYEEGSDKGVEGTPTFFVNGVMVKSKLGAIQRAIEAAMGSVGRRS